MNRSLTFLSPTGNMSYCTDVHGLTGSLGHTQRGQEWWLFTDASEARQKVFLLHIWNEFPSVPVFHATQMKEAYENMKLHLSCTQQNVHRWNTSGDVRVIALLVGTQLGCTKLCCSFCEWNSPAKDHHYSAKEWPTHKQLQRGRKNVRNEPLVDLRK